MSHYGTVLDCQAHWDARGYQGTTTAVLLTLGSMFVDSVGWRTYASGTPVVRFPGTPTSSSQVLQWPRRDASTVYGVDIPEDEVPSAVVLATYEAAWYEQQNPGQLNIPLRTDQHLARERYGEVEFSYFVAGRRPPTAGMAPTATFIPSVMGYLAPVLVDGGNPHGITGVVA